MDFRNAFDTTPRYRLLSRLGSSWQTSKKPLTGSKAFLTGRQQRVAVNGEQPGDSSGDKQHTISERARPDYLRYVQQRPATTTWANRHGKTVCRRHQALGPQCDTQGLTNSPQADPDNPHEWSEDWLAVFPSTHMQYCHETWHTQKVRDRGENTVRESQLPDSCRTLSDSRMKKDMVSKSTTNCPSRTTSPSVSIANEVLGGNTDVVPASG